MRTNIVLDDALVEEAARLSGIRTKTALVDQALREFVAAKKRKSLLSLDGKIALAPGYDYKATRPPGPPGAVREPPPRPSRRARSPESRKGRRKGPGASS